MDNTKCFKIIVIGATGVGKTSIVNRLINKNFEIETQSTIGVEFKTYFIDVEGEKIKLQIWDTAGQERFRSVSRGYFRNAVGALVVFDLTSRESFDKVSSWLEDLQKLGHPNSVAYLVGNKADMDSTRQVGMQEATEFATKQNMEYIETSALSGQNINDLFLRFTYKINTSVKNGTLVLPSLSTGTQDLQKKEEKSGCC